MFTFQKQFKLNKVMQAKALYLCLCLRQYYFIYFHLINEQNELSIIYFEVDFEMHRIVP